MLAVGSDHAAYEFKLMVLEHLEERGIAYKDFGTYSEDSSDYPLYGEAVGRAVASGEYKAGLIFCGTGVGISMAANKVKGIRAVVCSEPYSAVMAKKHNDSNILALGARVVGIELAKMIIDSWLDTEFEGGRHQRRVDLIKAIEDKD